MFTENIGFATLAGVFQTSEVAAFNPETPQNGERGDHEPR